MAIEDVYFGRGLMDKREKEKPFDASMSRKSKLSSSSIAKRSMRNRQSVSRIFSPNDSIVDSLGSTFMQKNDLVSELSNS